MLFQLLGRLLLVAFIGKQVFHSLETGSSCPLKTTEEIDLIKQHG